jgi:metallo-beta-lactamase family protein
VSFLGHASVAPGGAGEYRIGRRHPKAERSAATLSASMDLLPSDETRLRSRLEPRAGELARLTFLGAAGEVTGSSYLLTTARARVLVDCGMFQGGREEARRNRTPFAFAPAALDAVLLTHAHIDHCGRLPLLARLGYRGRIHCSAATRDVTAIMLADAAGIQEQDAERARRRASRGAPNGAAEDESEPLYSSADAERATRLLRAESWGEWFAVADGVRARLGFAGHILGAASIEVELAGGGGARRGIL